MAIVITDGKSSDTKNTSLEAELTRAAGIHVFAVGVGSSVDLHELHNIASKPVEQYAFQVRSFAALDSIKELLAIKTCTGLVLKCSKI